ncbi:OLC1v1018536C1 [Oldenlandia corymbosa var. corymbosa]|uniref:OLC1v1018536C1 n=1 Tax=Oldenlandia corymbosa var. corymbosa TaxID=529605 RepID=A0AAV1EC15_OLDCO|nr:OLC1v1018536C1 [Oldenlandia corymbosa var. corymbosa]
MACLGTSIAATCTTSLSITYRKPSGLGESVSIGNYPRRRTTSTSTATKLLQKLTITTRRNHHRGIRAAAEADTMSATEVSRIKIIKNPPESKLTELDVRSWPKWGCAPSKFPWTYSSKETCYLLKGKVKVYPDGSDEVAEFGAGDLVEFPKGMSCTWEVSEAVDKHYKFE